MDDKKILTHYIKEKCSLVEVIESFEVNDNTQKEFIIYLNLKLITLNDIIACLHAKIKLSEKIGDIKCQLK